MNVKRAELIVSEIEALDTEGWRRLWAHRRSADMLDEYLTALCITRFWCFMRYGLYFRNMAHYYPPLHGAEGLAGFLQYWHRSEPPYDAVNTKVVLIAREHCKTQEAMAYTLWSWVRDTDVRALIRGYSDPKAQEILAGIRDQVDRNDAFRARFSWVRPKTTKNGRRVRWSEHSIALDSEVVGRRTFSAEAVGIGADPTGGHYELGYYDDYEVRQNANSEPLREQMISQWKSDNPMFEGQYRRLLVGTPWARNGMLNQIRKRIKEFENHDYDVMVVPAEIEVFPKPFAGQDAVLQDDRRTFRCQSAGFPTVEGDLVYCQARIQFYSPVVKDVVTEIREVEWNDGSHFRVNRAIPAALGQPMQWSVLGRKPAAPNRRTFDSVDLPPEKGSIARKSLYKERRDQGSYIYSCQMMIDPTDKESAAFNQDQIGRFTWNEVKDDSDQKYWFRACDFASARKTSAFTSIMTAFLNRKGIHIVHIAHGNLSVTDILLELFLGETRVWDYGGQLKWTSLEKAHIESTLNELLKEQIEADPYEYFKRMRGLSRLYRRPYSDMAEEVFAGGRRVPLRRRVVNRGNWESKVQRILSLQPAFERGFIRLLKGIQHETLFLEQVDAFNPDAVGSFDMLDTLADIYRESHAPRFTAEEKPGEVRNEFEQMMRNALFKNRLRRASEMTGW